MSGMSKNDTAMLQEFLMEINTPSSTLSRVAGFISVFFSIIFSMVVFITASDDKEKNQKNLCCLLPYMSFHLFIIAFQLILVVYDLVLFQRYLKLVWSTFFVYTILMIVWIMAVVIVFAYYKRLKKLSGFSYVKMKDGEKNVTLENHVHQIKEPFA